MVRHRRITSDDVWQPLGDIAQAALALCLLVGLVAITVAGLLLWLVYEVVDWLQRRRFLGPVTFAVMVAVVVLHFVGCAAAPRPALDPRDPEVWRPATPATYPLPR